ncbi:hypothetical protein MTO96_024988 [Rhipicephalus appendiculatus]
MKSRPLFVAFVVLLVLFLDAAYGMDDLMGLLSDRVESVTNMARAFLAVFVGAFAINACAVIFIVFGDGRSRRFLFPLVVIYAALYLVFSGLAYLFLGLSGTVADRVRTLGSIMDTVSVGDVSDSAFSYIKVHEQDCRLRFVCELSEKAVQRDHMFALVLRMVQRARQRRWSVTSKLCSEVSAAAAATFSSRSATTRRYEGPCLSSTESNHCIDICSIYSLC